MGSSQPHSVFSLVNCTIDNLELTNNPAKPNNTKKIMASKEETNTNLSKVYADFQKFFATPRSTNARAVSHGIMAENHPNHHLINVNPDDFDFLEFAAAGYAIAELELENNCIDVGRDYQSPLGGRTYGEEAEVTERVYWGRYKYNWQNKDYILYKVNWKYEYDQDNNWSFLLYPRTAGELKAKCEEIDSLLLDIGRYTSLPHEDVFVFENSYTYRSKSMWHAIKNAKWDDVILDPAMKDSLMKDVISFFQPATKEIYTRYSLPYKRGIILHGSPGNGKTITIKALINTLQRQPEAIPTLYVKSMKDKCNGDQESLKRLFKEARKTAPCLLVFEDLDSLISSEIRSHFLNEIDGLESNDGICFIGSTNHLDNIDTAIRSRPSRFDRKYAFELPNRDGRVRYAQHWRAKLADNGDIDFPEEVCGLVADLTPDFSFAYLKELFISSLLTVSKGVREEDVEWDVVGSKSASVSDVSEKVSESSSESVEDVEKDGEKEGKNEEKPQKKKREVPQIVVPDTLKKNIFLGILQQQVKALIKDMDSSDEEEEKAEKEKKKQEEKDKKEEEHSCSRC